MPINWKGIKTTGNRFYYANRIAEINDRGLSLVTIATYTADMLKALYSELGEPHINNTDFNTNARAIATLKAKATGKKYSEVKDKSYTLYELLDVSSLIKEE